MLQLVSVKFMFLIIIEQIHFDLHDFKYKFLKKVAPPPQKGVILCLYHSKMANSPSTSLYPLDGHPCIINKKNLGPACP